jgi:hypothetical protein
MYSVYADLSRPLTDQEQWAVFEALEASVPGSGCVGRQKQLNDEVYFCIEANSDEAARLQAASHADTVLKLAGLDVTYALELVPSGVRE